MKRAEKQAILAAAKERGKAAFERGDKSAPVYDQEFIRSLGQIGDPMNIPRMDAWLRGWHEANAAAPVTEEETPEGFVTVLI